MIQNIHTYKEDRLQLKWSIFYIINLTLLLSETYYQIFKAQKSYGTRLVMR